MWKEIYSYKILLSIKMAQEHIYSDVAYTVLEANKIAVNYEEGACRSDYRYEASLSRFLNLF